MVFAKEFCGVSICLVCALAVRDKTSATHVYKVNLDEPARLEQLMYIMFMLAKGVVTKNIR